MSDDELVNEAIRAREQAYAPYSDFSVGAAVLTTSGHVFTGCNVENRSYRLTICAEQGALAAAVANGETGFAAVAVVADSKKPPVPCGACRQTLAEFNPGMKVIMCTIDGVRETMLLSELLPRPIQGILEQHNKRDV
jgi:cytidine deaminase